VEVTPTEDFGSVRFGARFSVQVHHYHGRVRLKIAMRNVQDGTHDIQTLFSFPVTHPGEEGCFTLYDSAGKSTQIDLEELLRFLLELPPTDNSLLSILGMIARSQTTRDLLVMIQQAISACELWWGWGCPLPPKSLEFYNNVVKRPPDTLNCEKLQDQWLYATSIIETQELSRKAEDR